jgi:hypothetical protein
MRKGPESVYDKCNIIVGVIEVLKVVNLNPIHGEVQLIQHYVIKYYVCNYSNMMGAISGAGSTYPSGVPEFILVFIGVRVTQSLVLWVMFVDRFSMYNF